MHHGMCVTRVSWCMSGSLTRCGVENVPVLDQDMIELNGNIYYLVWGVITYPCPKFNMVNYRRIHTMYG